MKNNTIYSTKDFIEKIVKRLPNKWSDINLIQYKEILKMKIGNAKDMKENLAEYYQVISLFTNVTVEELSDKLDYAMSVYAVNYLNDGLFSQEMKQVLDKDLVFKDITKFTANEFIFMMEIKPEQVWEEDYIFEYMNSFVYNKKTGEKLNYTKEEILELDVEFINTCFFLLIQTLGKYTNKLLVKESKKVILHSPTIFKARMKKWKTKVNWQSIKGWLRGIFLSKP